MHIPSHDYDSCLWIFYVLTLQVFFFKCPNEIIGNNYCNHITVHVKMSIVLVMEADLIEIYLEN